MRAAETERRWDLLLHGFFKDGTKPLFLYARESQGQWIAVVGSSRDPDRQGGKTYNRSWYYGDLSGVPLQDGRMKGRFTLYVTPDLWVPLDHKGYKVVFEIDAQLKSDNRNAGLYQALGVAEAASQKALAYALETELLWVETVRGRFSGRATPSEAEIDQELALAAEGRDYALVTFGRLGSSDPWLGVPVDWGQISRARVIVEAGLKDFPVTPSQGTHFFQNITSFGIGYFTVRSGSPSAFIDQKWLDAQKAESETKYVRHLSFDEPLEVAANSRTGDGVVMKPGVSLKVE